MHHQPNASARSRFSIGGRLKSFRWASIGILSMLKTQHNAWLHVAASLIVVCFAWWLSLSASDWRWLIAAIAIVWMAEAFNTAHRICL